MAAGKRLSEVLIEQMSQNPSSAPTTDEPTRGHPIYGFGRSIAGTAQINEQLAALTTANERAEKAERALAAVQSAKADQQTKCELARDAWRDRKRRCWGEVGFQVAVTAGTVFAVGAVIVWLANHGKESLSVRSVGAATSEVKT